MGKGSTRGLALGLAWILTAAWGDESIPQDTAAVDSTLTAPVDTIAYPDEDTALISARPADSDTVSAAGTDSALAGSDNTLIPEDSALVGDDSAGFAPEGIVELEAKRVKGRRYPGDLGGKSTLSARQIKRMPNLAEADIIRSVQALPGVVASSDFSTKIYVRGGASDQNLVLFDNAVVYSPVHFFGLFSTFLVEGVDEVQFYKGGFPAEYGNRLSSVLDIKSRQGGEDTVKTDVGGSLRISTFASQAHVEGRRGAFRGLLAARRTYIDFMLDRLRQAGLTDLDLPYAFYDMQGSGGYALGSGRDLMLSFYQGRDKLVFSPFEVEWGNTVIPLNYSGPLGANWSTRATASYSLFSQSFALENLFALYNRITTWNFKQAFEYAGLDRHRLALGADINWMQTIFENEQKTAKLRLRDYTGFWLNSGYLQDRWTLGSAELTPGILLTYSSRLPTPGAEPRLSLKYRLSGGQALDFHVGYYLQYVNSIQFQDQENLNEFYYPAKEVSYRTVNPTSSILFSAGYGVDRFRREWNFSLEGYYKTLDHLLVFAPNEMPDSLKNRTDITLGDFFKEGEGYSMGFEVSLRRIEGLVFGGVSYAHGLSVMRETGGDAYYPKWHQPHSFKADLALNWLGKDGLWGKGRKKYLRTSTQFKYATGLPYTEYIGYMSSHLLDESPGRGAGGPGPEFNGNQNTIRGNRNAALVPAYQRLDVKVVDWGRDGHWNFALTFINVTDHKNIFFYTYDRRTNPPTQVEITQFPFFPLLLSYEYHF